MEFHEPRDERDDRQPVPEPAAELARDVAPFWVYPQVADPEAIVEPVQEAWDVAHLDSARAERASSVRLPLLEAARVLVKDTPEGRALDEKLQAFAKLDDAAKQQAAPEIRKDIADIVARTVTEEHQRTQRLEALANFRTDQTLTASEPAERQERHPLVAQILDGIEDVLAELGKEMLIEALLPGAHILLPPTDFIDSLFTAVELFEIAEDPEPWPHAAWP